MINRNRYFDKHGVEIAEGCKIKYENGAVKTVYAWSDQEENVGLGTDATNPKWIESGRAYPCEYGIFPFSRDETNEVEVVMDCPDSEAQIRAGLTGKDKQRIINKEG